MIFLRINHILSFSTAHSAPPLPGLHKIGWTVRIQYVLTLKKYLVEIAASHHDETESGEMADATEALRIGGVQRVAVVGEDRPGEHGRVAAE